MLLEPECKPLFREYNEKEEDGSFEVHDISLCSQRSPVFNMEFGLLPPWC